MSQWETVVHSVECAERIDDCGLTEPGKRVFVERTQSAGGLRLSYEYNFYYWPESDEWTVDVISPHGWTDADEIETMKLIDELNLRIVVGQL